MKTLLLSFFLAGAAMAADVKLSNVPAVTTLAGENGILIVIGDNVKQVSLTNFATVLSGLGGLYDPANVLMTGGSFSGFDSGTFSNQFHNIHIGPTSIDFDGGVSLYGSGAANTFAIRDGNQDIEVFLGAVPGTAGGGTLVLNPADVITPPVAGQIYFDKSTLHFMGYNGTAWKQLDN